MHFCVTIHALFEYQVCAILWKMWEVAKILQLEVTHLGLYQPVYSFIQCIVDFTRLG